MNLLWAMGTLNQGQLNVSCFAGTGDKTHAVGKACVLFLWIMVQPEVKFGQIFQDLIPCDYRHMDGRHK